VEINCISICDAILKVKISLSRCTHLLCILKLVKYLIKCFFFLVYFKLRLIKRKDIIYLNHTKLDNKCKINEREERKLIR
jgi:hypothetical protein